MTHLPTRPSESPVPLESARTRLIDALSAHFAHDAITIEELDRRLDAAYQATSVAELERLVDDLPPRGGGSAAVTAPAGQDGSRAGYRGGQPGDEDVERVVSIMAETRRTGLWVVPRRLDLLSIMSSTVIDLRNASLAPGVTDIELSAMMTEVKILLPPGVHVVNRATSFMTSMRDRTAIGVDPGPSAPVVRLTGWAVMADVTVE